MNLTLPPNLEQSLDSLLAKLPLKNLRILTKQLSQRYREGKFFLTTYDEKVAYLAVRLPATYAAITDVLSHIPNEIETICDYGSGPGTGILAAQQLFNLLKKSTAIEHDNQWIHIGQQLVNQCAWIKDDITKFKHSPCDLALFSYSLNEIPLPQCENLLKLVWSNVNKYLVIIEPGTPKGYQRIISYRSILLNQGAHIFAPCPHTLKCPLQDKENDWCHFSKRLTRSSLHRLLKDAELNYEDEKFSYLIVSKNINTKVYDRVIRHPKIGKGHTKLTLCTHEGHWQETTISKKDGPLYKLAKDTEWGDEWPIN
ncbi:MAG: hypothetical protein JHC93_00440 [Parachlamydiales bacterium]|nr:hypothetical protein [Parachlamydiales bacterium]